MDNKFNGDTVLAYCRQLTQNGERLTMLWHGGNDVGHIFLLLNDEPLDEWIVGNNLGHVYLPLSDQPSDECHDSPNEHLISYITESLDGFSFTGNFYREGRCEFNPEKGYFTGTDTYSEDREETEACDFELQVPSDFWFDAIQISIHGDYGFLPTVELNFEIQNGPIPKSCDQLEKSLQDQLEKVMNRFVAECDRYINLSHDISIPRSEFVDKNGFLSHMITEMSYSYKYYDDETIIIDFNKA